ncbi:hypothetical protein NDU88_003045 [Pleurodeles waltl]|uniref:Uncharacterized protein n=1 Tax=Pleurodeles waltl TaxID=8319 RepID=A0AAV7WR99_PLEWA|nr:hypothetical protein NDU88_003045 [Pleurodeles waltl]
MFRDPEGYGRGKSRLGGAPGLENLSRRRRAAGPDPESPFSSRLHLLAVVSLTCVAPLRRAGGARLWVRWKEPEGRLVGYRRRLSGPEGGLEKGRTASSWPVEGSSALRVPEGLGAPGCTCSPSQSGSLTAAVSDFFLQLRCASDTDFPEEQSRREFDAFSSAGSPPPLGADVGLTNLWEGGRIVQRVRLESPLGVSLWWGARAYLTAASATIDTV